jgi:hypothetical protein
MCVCIYRAIHKSLRNIRTRLCNNQDRHSGKELLSTCKVGQKLGVSLPLLTCSRSAWPSLLLYLRGWKSWRDLRITLHTHTHTHTHTNTVIPKLKCSNVITIGFNCNDYCTTGLEDWVNWWLVYKRETKNSDFTFVTFCHFLNSVPSSSILNSIQHFINLICLC